MRFDLQFTAAALRELKKLPKKTSERILAKTEAMRDDLKGDVKRLHGDPGFRLRVGDFRVLFDLEGTAIVVHNVRHRREAYRR